MRHEPEVVPGYPDRVLPKSAAAKHLLARDVAYLIRLCLIAENDGRLSLTDIGRERYRALPRPR